MLAGLGGAVVVPGTAVGTPDICRVLSPFIRGSYRQEGHASTTDTWSYSTGAVMQLPHRESYGGRANGLAHGYGWIARAATHRQLRS